MKPRHPTLATLAGMISLAAVLLWTAAAQAATKEVRILFTGETQGVTRPVG